MKNVGLFSAKFLHPLSCNTSGSKYSSASSEICDGITTHDGMAENNAKCSFRRIILGFF